MISQEQNTIRINGGSHGWFGCSVNCNMCTSECYKEWITPLQFLFWRYIMLAILQNPQSCPESPHSMTPSNTIQRFHPKIWYFFRTNEKFKIVVTVASLEIYRILFLSGHNENSKWVNMRKLHDEHWFGAWSNDTNVNCNTLSRRQKFSHMFWGLWNCLAYVQFNGIMLVNTPCHYHSTFWKSNDVI